MHLMRALVFGFVWCFLMNALMVTGVLYWLSLIPAFIIFEIIEGVVFKEAMGRKDDRGF